MKFSSPSLLTLLFLVLVLFGLGSSWIWGLFETAHQAQIESRLQAQIQRLEHSLDKWTQSRQREVQVIVSTPQFRAYAENLRQANGTLNSKTVKDLTAWLNVILKGLNYQGFYIMDQKGQVLIQSDQNTITEQIPGNGPELSSLDFKRMAKGAASISIPGPLQPDDGNPDNASIYIGIALPAQLISSSNGNSQNTADRTPLILVFALSAAPWQALFDEAAQFNSDELLAFDSEAKLMTRSRFQADLQKKGLFSSPTDLAPGIRLYQPVNAHSIDTNRPVLIPGKSLALNAAEAIAGKNGVSTTPFINFRGESVVAAWAWLNESGYGITYEIEAEEALALMQQSKVLWILLTAVSMLLMSVLFVYFTITREKVHRLSTERQHNEERLTLALEAANEGIWDWDVKGGEVFFSPRWFSMLGYQPTQGPHNFKTLTDLVHPEDKNDVINELVTHASWGDGYKLQFRMRAFNGQYRWVLSKGKVIERDRSGNAIRLINTQADITDRVEYEEKLKQLNQQLESTVSAKTAALEETQSDLSLILEASGEGIIGLDNEGAITFANEAVSRLTGYANGQLLGQSFHDLLHHHYPNGRAVDYTHSQITKTQNDGQTRQQENDTFVRQDGTHLPVEYTVSTLKDAKGHAKGVVIVFRDSTQRKRYELAQQDAVKAANEANQAKSAFLANMSHEIRTPLNAIIGLTELALNNIRETGQRSYIQKIKDSASILLGIINDILDFSKIEAGKLEVSLNTENISNLLHQQVTLFRLAARDQQNLLLVYIHPTVPQHVEIDGCRVGQILSNLISNAIKFTRQGEVRIDISVSNRDQNKKNAIELEFRIRDTGVGMDKTQQKHVFNAFAQADSSTTRQFSGTGLGLAICKRLIAIMGGNIQLNSKPNAGTDVVFTLPCQRSEQVDNLNTLYSGPIETVHFISENASLRDNIQFWVSNAGLGVHTFSTQALEHAVAEADSSSVFIIDTLLPEEIQSQLLNLISRAQSHSPVIYLEHVPTRTYREPRFVVDTPLTGTQTLIEILENIPLGSPDNPTRVLSSNAAVIDSNTEPDIFADFQKRFRHNRILLVEDNITNREVACALLECTGIQIDVASDGQQAIDKIVHNQYDAVLMDIQMPILNGYQATRIIRQNNPTIPIIALTANATEHDKVHCIECGMNDFIAKPFAPKALFNTLQHWLDLGEPQITDPA
ncbi:hypothetical protein OLMES_0600 [Oleiphilus messinensis]|uniref:Sensory/regulatory protein RpfC n=1 Tax=Oleiphilus messinensis TaxID=141451 RepID=A0A1Y0I5M1_9GAMM|nr:hypothetical protein OLMES_0600 [Oleiphilus messinensis]